MLNIIRDEGKVNQSHPREPCTQVKLNGSNTLWQESWVVLILGTETSFRIFLETNPTPLSHPGVLLPNNERSVSRFRHISGVIPWGLFWGSPLSHSIMFERSIHVLCISTYPFYGKINTLLYGYTVHYLFISWWGYCHCLAIVLNPVNVIVPTALRMCFCFSWVSMQNWHF